MSRPLLIAGPTASGKSDYALAEAAKAGAIINAIERIADEESNVMVRKGMFCVNAYLHRRFDEAGSAKNNLRASVYFYNTLDECDVFCDVVERVVKNPLDYLDDA